MPRPKRARRAPPAGTHEATASGQVHEVGSNKRSQPQAFLRRSSRSSAPQSVEPERQLPLAASTALFANQDAAETGNAMGDDDAGSPPEVGRRSLETPAPRRDTSGLDLADDEVFGDLDDSFEDGAPPRAGSVESGDFSMSSLMKPRSRQSSIIGRNDPPIRPTSRSGSTPGVSSSFNIGLFRRRPREPSILGTSRKAMHDTTTSTASTVQQSVVGSDDDEDDFAPEAVSTPLSIRRRSRRSGEAIRNSDLATADRTGTRKRKSEETRHSGAPPEKTARTKQQAEDSDSDSELSSLPSPQHRPSTPLQRPVTPDDEDIIAPPASSGSESEGGMWPDIHALAKRRRRPSVTSPLRADNDSDISSPPSLTHSPNNLETGDKDKAHKRSNTCRQASPKITTADLANMLPKRRHQKHRAHSGGPEDLQGLSSTHEDNAGRASRPGSRTATRKMASSRAGNAQPSKGSDSALQPKQRPASGRPGLRSRAHAHPSSDKENDSQSEGEEEPSSFVPMPDDTFDADTDRPKGPFSTEELENATKKFKEVDQWELSFEEVEPTSSPKGAR